MMDYYSVPNWLRIILVVLSVFSFVPQFSRTIARRRSSGISTYYVLFNLISATEQFALTFFYVVNHFDESDFFVHRPVNAGDWINLVQTVVITIIWFAFFVLCLYLPSDNRDGSVKFAIGAYMAFLAISIVPIFSDAIAPESSRDRYWLLAIYFAIHSIFLSWIVSGLNIVAIYCQARRLRSQTTEQSLSQMGLVCQAAIFMLLAVSWAGRVEFPYKNFGGFPWQALSTWYQMVGWAAVDTAIFALGQAVLKYLVSRHNRSIPEPPVGESEPLLRA